MSALTERFDADIFDLIPHRPPMLLINHIRGVSANNASSIVLIDDESLFYQPNKGVPSWVGLEYMGQTAAMIAGFQIRSGQIEPHLGFLIGSRQYTAYQEYFRPNSRLTIKCTEAALVGESLATFACTIEDETSKKRLADASVSVFRKPLPSSTET